MKYKLALLSLLLVCAANSFAQASCIPPPGGHCVALSWGASPTPNVTYNVYRSTTSPSCKTTKVASGLTALTFNDMNVVNGTTYFYSMSAQNSGGESACTSPDVQAQIPTPPGSPINPNAVIF